MRNGGDVIAVRLWTNASDDTAFETCVREYSPMVFRIAFSVLRNPHAAEDAAQDTFLRALRSGKLKDAKDTRAWLARIAWRTALDHRRTEDVDIEAVAEPASPLLDVESRLLQEERTKLLHELIRSLPKELQEVVTLSTVQELSGADIAEILGIPEASVRTRMYRARTLMKEKLESKLRGRSADRS